MLMGAGDDADADELEELDRRLEHRVPIPYETPPERRADALVEALLLEAAGGEDSPTVETLRLRARELLDAVRMQDDV